MPLFKRIVTIISVVGGATGYLGLNRILSLTLLGENKSAKSSVPSKFEIQFRKFASREYVGVLFMTPNDFLQSMFKESSTVRHFHSLSNEDVKQIAKKSSKSSSLSFFRELGNEGLISYTDYLFLLGLLNKPSAQFEVFFDLLDVDYSGTIDANEFSALYKVSAGDPQKTETLDSCLSLFPQGDLSLQSSVMQRLFGFNGKKLLRKKEFYEFIENFQSEIIEVEFFLNSINGTTISAVQFARILLQYTHLPESTYQEFLNRVNRLPSNLEISLQDFKNFYKFMNHLDDFQMAMKMYILANKPISLREFKHAIKTCTNILISEIVLQTLFCMFDEDGDGHMSPQEFTVLLKNRRPRGIPKKNDSKSISWKNYKRCVSRALGDQ